MEIPVFSRWWEVVLFLLFALIMAIIGIIVSPIIFAIKLLRRL